MKQNKNIFPSLSSAAALLIATMFASCTKAELEAPVVKQGAEIRFGIEKNITSTPLTKSGSESESRVLLDYDSNDPSSVGLSMTVVDGIETPISKLPATKGTQISQKEQVTSFDVISYLYADESATNGALFLEDTVIDGVNTTNNTYYWPPFGVMDFIAAYPSDLFDENEMQTKVKENGQIQFNYTIPSAVEEQQDIMIAMTNDVDCTVGAPVPLQFKHLLAAVQFKVGDMMLIKINSLSIENVKGDNITINYGENGWTYESEISTKYDVIYPKNGEPNFDTSGLPTGSYIAGNDNGLTMFVMPQNLGADQKIKIAYTELATGESETKEISFSGDLAHSWQAGKTTTYVLNIGTTVDIKIPTPPDADAHYVRIDMQYDFSQLAQRGFKNFKATAYWENDENNDASSDKQDIALSTSLSQMQRQGYFTDELWTLEYEILDNGKYKVPGSNVELDKIPAPIYSESLLGDTEIPLEQSKGTVYLFLDENNGTINRKGVLKVTGTIDGISKPITIGIGAFEQLCPSWNDSNIGVERFESLEEEFPYGFNYSRKVRYTSDVNTGLLDIPVLGFLYELYLLFTGGITNEVLPDGVEMAKDFVKIDSIEVLGTKVPYSVEFDYSALNKVSEVAATDNGLLNTAALYGFSGNIDISDLEQQIKKNLPNWKERVINEAETPDIYAAFIALKCNRMREVFVTIKSKNDDSKFYKVLLHKESEGNGVSKGESVDETSDDVIEWYLPSSEEGKTLKEIGTTDANLTSPLNGEYWSSTAGDDSNAYAHSFTYNDGTFVSVNQQKPRMDKLKVRAVRKKPTAN